MSGRVVRDELGDVVVDDDGRPVVELSADRVDAMAERGATVAELATGRRSWRFGHVIVDEAQDLTPMQWRMVLRRARGHSMTVVGDLSQRSAGPARDWAAVLPPELDRRHHRELTINYRSPVEVNAAAATLLAELAPGLTSPRAIRATGRPPSAVCLPDAGALPAFVATTRRRHPEGTMAVVGWELDGVVAPSEVEVLDPHRAKGLEFDTVVVVEPATILRGTGGLADLYVSMTRATADLYVAHTAALPELVERALAAGRRAAAAER